MMKIDCNFEAIEKLNHPTLSLFRSFDPSSAELPLATKTSGEMRAILMRCNTMHPGG